MEGLAGMGDVGCDHPGVPKGSNYSFLKIIPKYAMISTATFQSSTRGVEVYMLKASKLVQTQGNIESNKGSIPMDN